MYFVILSQIVFRTEHKIAHAINYISTRNNYGIKYNTMGNLKSNSGAKLLMF